MYNTIKLCIIMLPWQPLFECHFLEFKKSCHDIYLCRLYTKATIEGHRSEVDQYHIAGNFHGVKYL